MHLNLEAEHGLRRAVDALNSFVNQLRANYELSDNRLAGSSPDDRGSQKHQAPSVHHGQC